MRPSEVFRSDLLEGKVALITGGGTGIGAATALELGRMGATVVIASRKPDHIRPAVEGMTRLLGREVFGAQLDIRDPDRCRAVVDEICQAHGSLDILVNNGGGQFFSPAEMISDNGFDAVVRTNLMGTWNMCRAAHDRWMGEHGGSIVQVTMLTGAGFPGMAHSVSARAGVEEMTRTLAVEWAPKNIRVNAVQPGVIASAGMKRYPVELGVLDTLPRIVPMKRLGTCDEVAWLISYLACPGASYVTGQVVAVCGGKSHWGDWWPIPDPDDMQTAVVPDEPWEQPTD